jgi:hypothetical protein
LVTTFQDTGSVCHQCTSGDKTAEIYGRTDFKQCVSCNNGMWLEEFNIAVGFMVYV